MTPEEILNQRKNKFLKIGRSKGFINDLENLSSIEYKKDNIKQFFNKKNILYLAAATILIVGIFTFIL